MNLQERQEQRKVILTVMEAAVAEERERCARMLEEAIQRDWSGLLDDKVRAFLKRLVALMREGT